MDFNCKQSFIEVSLTDIRDAIYLASHEINSEIIDLLDKGDVVLTCYGSDARLDKWNRGKSSIDLLVCNKSELVSSEEIKKLLKEFVEKTKDLVVDNTYHEFGIDGEVYQVQDEIPVGKEISTLAQNDYYIDVLNFTDELHKYENKTFPDRLIDAYNIYGKTELLLEFKQKMLEDIIASPKILKDFRNDVKGYFREEIIRGKNLRKSLASHFDFDGYGEIGLLKYDREDFFGFKHGPLRALQYKIIEKFIKLVIDKKDSSLVINFPFPIDKRMNFLLNNNSVGNLNTLEVEELVSIYKFFRDKNDEINFMYLSKKYSSNLRFIREFHSFIFENEEYLETKSKLDRFVELFQKLATS